MFHELESIFSFAIAKNRPRFFLSTLPALKHKLAHRGGQVSDFPICTVLLPTVAGYTLLLYCVYTHCGYKLLLHFVVQWRAVYHTATMHFDDLYNLVCCPYNIYNALHCNFSRSLELTIHKLTPELSHPGLETPIILGFELNSQWSID